MSSPSDPPLRVVFLHPDLGIGGAERSMVDAAVALKNNGHSVHMVTAHHDPAHCFPETRDSTLPVTVVGDWLPRSTLGRLFALWAYVRMVVAALYLVLAGPRYDLVFCDQVSACIPVLKLARAKVAFYCHFPDMLLTKRETTLKKLYRAPLDWVEEKTTGMADVVMVNSQFTAGVFHATFTSLAHITPEVIYPIPNLGALRRPAPPDHGGLLPADTSLPLLLSINRYERKKNLPLALHALAEVRKETEAHLVMAGGYDTRVAENVEHHAELGALAQQLGLTGHVTFLRSFSDEEKLLLLARACCLLYTPEREHFGMVPIEAMFLGCPVVACSSGGPLETVVDGQTGFLCRPTAEEFGAAAAKLVGDEELRDAMSRAARERVEQHFSYRAFSHHLNTVVTDLARS